MEEEKKFEEEPVDKGYPEAQDTDVILDETMDIDAPIETPLPMSERKWYHKLDDFNNRLWAPLWTPLENKFLNPFYSYCSSKFLFGLSYYQYLVLISAWLGWLFDMFDAILFNYAAPVCIPNLLGYEDSKSIESQEAVALWSAIMSSVLLVGWGVGGIFFGILTDKIGRSRTMMLTIVTYSVATALCAASFHISFLVVMRFIAALGIGGEYASGASLIAEVLPADKKLIGGVLLYSAAPVGGIVAYLVNFLFTSLLINQISNSWSWRIVFLTGLIPVFVGILVRLFIREPETWKNATESSSFLDLFRKEYRSRTIGTIVLVILSLIAWWSINTFIPVLATFVAVQGKNLYEWTEEEFRFHLDMYTSVGLVCYNLGGLLGTLLVIPIATKWGRKWVFKIYYAMGCVVVALSFGLPDISPWIRFACMFPVGFFIFGIFGQFIFYLPELYPVHLRGLLISISLVLYF